MSNLASVRNFPKSARKVKDDIKSIGHLLTHFCKNSLFLVALNLEQKSALSLTIKNCTGLILSSEGMT